MVFSEKLYELKGKSVQTGLRKNTPTTFFPTNLKGKTNRMGKVDENKLVDTYFHTLQFLERTSKADLQSNCKIPA